MDDHATRDWWERHGLKPGARVRWRTSRYSTGESLVSEVERVALWGVVVLEGSPAERVNVNWDQLEGVVG